MYEVVWDGLVWQAIVRQAQFGMVPLVATQLKANKKVRRKLEICKSCLSNLSQWKNPPMTGIWSIILTKVKKKCGMDKYGDGNNFDDIGDFFY